MICVYSTNHALFLRYAHALGPERGTYVFLSNVTWRSAREEVDAAGRIPIIFRSLPDDEDTGESEPLACTYRAELVAVHLRDDFGTDAALIEWVTPQLDFQRGAYAFDDSELSLAEIEVRVAAEAAAFAEAATIYEVRDPPTDAAVAAGPFGEGERRPATVRSLSLQLRPLPRSIYRLRLPP